MTGGPDDLKRLQRFVAAGEAAQKAVDEITLGHLERRLDGLEAAAGELRHRIEMLERAVGADVDVGKPS